VPEYDSSSSNSLLFGRFAAHFTAAGKNSYTDYIVFPLPFLVKKFPFSYTSLFVIFFFQKSNEYPLFYRNLSPFHCVAPPLFWIVLQTTHPRFVQFAHKKERGG
jgi:hypothetical protein